MWVDWRGTGRVARANGKAAYLAGFVAELRIRYETEVPGEWVTPQPPQNPTRARYEWAARRVSLRLSGGRELYAGEGNGWAIEVSNNDGPSKFDQFDIKERGFHLTDNPWKGQYSDIQFPPLDGLPFHNFVLNINTRNAEGGRSVLDSVEIPSAPDWSRFETRGVQVDWVDGDTQERADVFVTLENIESTVITSEG